ncbi:hypothetical protein JXO52_05120 [bacterium]|nr:hypothetical protein [bacterium]
MLITPLAAESMGGRSMATSIETGDCRVIIDPWLQEAPLRFGLGPHPVEIWHAEKLKSRIRLFLRSADVVIVTHYDAATFSLLTPDICRGKTIFMRNPNQNTAPQYRNTIFEFSEKIRRVADELAFVDGRSLKRGKTKLHFSLSVPGTPETLPDFVMPVSIRDRKQTFFYSSETAGSLDRQAERFFREEKPHTCYLDGPETTWRKDGGELGALDQLIKRYMELLLSSLVQVLVIDHHLMRDIHWREKAKLMFKMAEKSALAIKTAAEFRGDENNLLEARRDQLYEIEPPK